MLNKRVVSGVIAWIVSRMIVVAVVVALVGFGIITTGVICLVLIASLIAGLWFALVVGGLREKRSMWKR